jgi:hypothetical protein
MFRREELLMTLVDYLLREFITHLLREGEKLVQMGSNSLFLIGNHGKKQKQFSCRQVKCTCSSVGSRLASAVSWDAI